MAVKVKKAVVKKGSAVKAKAVAIKKAVVKPVAKKTVAVKPAGKAATIKGDSYVCEECGLIVSVDETCGSVDFYEIFCCGEPMAIKKSRAKK
jgi:hypothetical protein